MSNIAHSLVNGVLILTMPEKLTLDAVQEMGEEKDRILSSYDHACVVCDASGIKILDSSGISFFLTLHNALKKEEKGLFLYKPTAQTLNLLAIVRLRDIFRILPDEAALEAVLKTGGNNC